MPYQGSQDLLQNYEYFAPDILSHVASQSSSLSSEEILDLIPLEPCLLKS